MEKEIGIEEARKRLGDLANEVFYTGRSVTLTRKGRPVARITPLQEEGVMTTYTYAIEISEDGQGWMLENNTAVGTEESEVSAREFAEAVLSNRIADLESDQDVPGRMRVVVWEGDRQASIDTAAAVIGTEEEA